MPSIKFALDPGAPERLEVRWEGLWRDVTVHLDGQEIGAIESIIELHHGKSFTLPDGSTLKIMKRTRSLGNVELHVTRDGKPLPGVVSEAQKRLKGAAHVLYFIAAFTLAGGIGTLLFHPSPLLPRNVGWIDIVGSVIYAVLGALTLRRSKAALITAITILTLSTLAMFVIFLQMTGRMPLLLIARVILVGPLIGGFQAIDELNAAPGEASSQMPE